MENRILEKNLISFIKNTTVWNNLYWVPLNKLKKNIPVVSYDVEKIGKDNAEGMLKNVFKICGISDVSSFNMVDREYYEPEDVFELLFDEDGSFCCYAETFFFDSSRKWMVYTSHEFTVAFAGKKIVEVAIPNIDDTYRLS